MRLIARALFLLPFAVSPSLGCTTTLSMLLPDQPDGPPIGIACALTSTWNNQVVFVADPTHNGIKRPGLTGRLYLFGKDMKFPLAAEGELIVDLYDDGPANTTLEPKMLEEWRIDNK